ncbi:recombinase family protein [Phenylobacterium sp.]|jgi:DNA invertase Pin-like site-specific DNA recombinase|uniref:recombinase family protein n=1 Tax=Phenylobacterium sp. TaxID=1871053 RepID=UPI002F3ED16B
MRRIGYVRRPERVPGFGCELARDFAREDDAAAEAEALRAAGCDEVRLEVDATSGGDAFAVLHALLDAIGPGDQLVVGRLERLGGSGRAMLAVLERLERRGAGLEIIRPTLSSRGPGGTALRAALEAVAAAEPNGGARPRRAAATQEIRALQEAGVGPVEIARRLGVSRMTVWRKLKAAEGFGGQSALP